MVKDGYHLENNSMAPPPSQSVQADIAWWKNLWQLNIPPKIRIFMWRASLDLLSTALNLARHHIPVDEHCFLCKFYCASTAHCIFFCPAVRNAWKTTTFWYCLKSCRSASFIECAIYVRKTFNTVDFELFICCCWAIWVDVCKRKHEGTRSMIGFRLDWVYVMLDNLRNSRLAMAANANKRQQTGNLSWHPPLHNQFRLDVNAGFDKSRNIFSIGAIVRDFKGVVCGAHAYTIRNPGSVLCAEMVAIRCGIDLCLKLELSNVCIYSDSSEAVKAILSPADEFGTVGVLALDIKSFIGTNQFLSIIHMNRLVNCVAHALARKALSTSIYLEWPNGFIPPWLSSIVTRDIQS